MSTHATSTFEVKNWDEQTCSEVDGHVKLTRANVAFSYRGDLEATSAMQYLMLYRDDGTASVIGLERVTGRLGAKSGSFVLQYTGNYADGVASGDLEVVSGSATGELAGLHGRGTAVAHHEGKTTFTLDYDLG
jgi:Protein of unknown function (DUF3224)